jgi:hypothetical protein
MSNSGKFWRLHIIVDIVVIFEANKSGPAHIKLLLLHALQSLIAHLD